MHAKQIRCLDSWFRGLLAPLMVTTLLATLTACGDPELGPDSAAVEASEGGKEDGFGETDGRDFTVVLTDPYCDVCTSADKDWLRTNSPIIREVVAAIDAAESTIDVAQFTFSAREIEAALAGALERGVSVRVAMDSGQSHNALVARLAEQGAQTRFIAGRTGIGEENRSGLQHAKFMLVDGVVLVNGSNNWSSTGTTFNEENTIILRAERDDAFLQAFGCYYEKMWESQFDTASECSTEDIQFSPSGGTYRLIRDAIRASEESVDVLMHHLVYNRLPRDLAQAAERGVRVRVVVNLADRDEHTGRYWDRLVAAGGEIRYKQTNTDMYQIMHDKLVIVDGRVLVNGSGNWSGSAFFNNYENFIRYTQPSVVQPFVGLFHRLWDWSLTGASADGDVSAARQHFAENRVFFGNLHAHYELAAGDDRWDDGNMQRADQEGVRQDIDFNQDDPAAYAYGYARDQGLLDFLLLSPHCSNDNPDDPAEQPNIPSSAFDGLRDSAEQFTQQSGGSFLALAGVEWSTTSVGNHVNIFGVDEAVKVERGQFGTLYDEYLPSRAAIGERPIVQFNHPRTFPRDPESRRGKFDQFFEAPIGEMERSGDRGQLFNDYGLDDYPPLSDVRATWIEQGLMADEAIVEQTLSNLELAARPYVRLMEVTVGRGTEIDHEEHQNPSLVQDAETGEWDRYVKVHTDWDYYLLHGFKLAPTANHDNHYANWGTGHTTRTAVIADELTESAVLAAIDNRAVYATEDENLEVRFYAADRVPAGGTYSTLSSSVSLSLYLDDPDYVGSFGGVIYGARVGSEHVLPVMQFSANAGQWQDFEITLTEPGEWFFYVEVNELDANRFAWSAPIWVNRLD